MNEKQYVLGTYGRAPIQMERGEGSFLFDVTGKRYVDFCAGIATCCLGHSHPGVVKALETQARKLMRSLQS